MQATKTILSTFIFLLISFIINAQWQQVGQDIEGQAIDDRFGTSTAVNNDGTIIAVSARWNDTNGNASGQVRVYRVVDGIFNLLGQPINGIGSGDNAGIAIDLNDQGNILAVSRSLAPSSIEIYEFNGTSWVTLGAPIPSPNPSPTVFGSKLSLNGLGNRLITSDFIANSLTGTVHVYEYNNSSWVQLGNTLNGVANQDQYGVSVSISHDGNIIAAGASFANSNTNNSGTVNVYALNNGIWEDHGNIIVGNTDAYIGGIVSLNSSGNRLIVRALNPGAALIFENVANTWIQLGSAINTESSTQGFTLLDFDSTGDSILLGNGYNIENPLHYGLIKIYHWDNNDWVFNHEELGRDYFRGAFGLSGQMSGDGNSVIVGDPYIWSGSSTQNPGYASVFSINNVNQQPLTYVPDDAFETRLQQLGYDSGPLDDYVLTSNINTLTSIDLSIAGISTPNGGLTGIEDFIALQQLFAENNNLTSVDLSNNMALTYLDIDNNQLTALNISSNTNLEVLYAEFNQLSNINLNGLNNLQELYVRDNSLSAIDLTTLSNLTIFSGYNNNFTSLDASQNSNLTIFLANGNDLMSLDIRNGNNTNIVGNFFTGWANPNLTCIFVDDAAYSTTNWVNIDAASTFVETQVQCDALSGPPPGLTYVPDDNFELRLQALGYDAGPLDDYVLTANINTVTNLNVSLQGISDMTGIEDFVALEILKCANNSITLLDLSLNTNLTFLECFENQITNINVVNSPDLYWLVAYNNQLTTINTSGNAALTNLNCSNNLITDLDVSQNPLLYEFVCSQNQLTNLDVSQNPDLYQFMCNDNQIVNLDVTQNTNLWRLFCHNNQIQNLDLTQNMQLASFWAFGNPMETIDIRNANNTIITDFQIQNMATTLNCVFVDNVAYSVSNWTNVHDSLIYKENESDCINCTPPEVDTLVDVSACTSYMLPNLTNGNYYSASGGNGTTYNEGDLISTSQVIYIYAEDVTDPTCNSETSFNVTINPLPTVDILNDVSSCGVFALSNLTNGEYYTQSGGNGLVLNPGDVISSSQTIYIYNEQNGCSAESSFTITIGSGGLDDWVQIGQDIDGQSNFDSAGRVALSANGKIMAVGAPGSDANGTDAGHVRIYENVSGNWVQIGQDIVGDVSDDRFGGSVTISSDGTIVAASSNFHDGLGPGTNTGLVKVYQNIAGSWNQIGQNIIGDGGTYSGDAVALSSNGNILSIGSFNDNDNGTSSGSVKVYEIIAGMWTQIGQDIIGDAAFDRLGSSIDLSANGNILAIGASWNSVNGPQSGHVKVFQNISNNWVQIGQSINGEAASDYSGHVALSADGSVLAIGATRNDGSGVDSGHVRIYENISGVWSQVGQDIDGESTDDNSGKVDISANGNIVVIGAHQNSSSGPFSGHVRVYENNSGTWVQLGQDIDGEAVGDRFGSWVTISADGKTVASGSPNNNGSAGHARVFNIQSSSQPTLVDTLPNITGCDSYTLTALTHGNYFTQSGGLGTALSAGDIVSTSQTIYIYNEDPSDPSCNAETSFNVTINLIPNVDTLNDITTCSSYTLPNLIDGSYFSQADGAGTSLNAGDIISTTQTIYIYNEVLSCTNESSFTVTISSAPAVDTLPNVTECDSYILTALTNGNYFTQSGGLGTALFAGDIVSTSQTIYIYNEDPSDPSCSAETSFNVIINPIPNVDTLNDVTTCSSYTLPNLIDGSYFSQADGAGTSLNAGDIISTTQTIYIYNEVLSCTNESSFTVTISSAPAVDTLPNFTECDSYILTALTHGNYFTQSGGLGTALSAGDIVSTSQIIYIYNEDPSDPSCSAETSFNVTINPIPNVDTLNDITTCSSYTLPNLIDGSYFSQADGAGTSLNAGDIISTTQTIYIYNEVLSCTNESSFTVTISSAPAVDTLPNFTECDSYTLTALTHGNYFTQSGGLGTALSAGDIVSTSQTIYIYNEDPSDSSCNAETNFNIIINPIPNVDTLNDITTCSSYTLPNLIDGSYFSQADGAGTSLNAGDIISTTQTIYIYNEVLSCINESSFIVTISSAPAVDTLADVAECGSYTLPSLTHGNYFTQSGGLGTALSAGDIVSTSQIIYIYNEDLSDSSCNAETSFNATINPEEDFILGVSNLLINGATVGIIVNVNDVTLEYAIDNDEFTLNSIFENLTEGEHIIYVRDINGCIEKSLVFSIDNKRYNFPKFFTPNGDSDNDVWIVEDLDHVIERINIFDRYGKLIITLAYNSLGWDGTKNGKFMMTNDYWYRAEFFDGKFINGHFALKR